MRNSNDERDMMDYDQAKKLRREILAILLLAGAVLVIVLLIVRFNQVNELKEDIKDKQEEKKNVQAYNKKIDSKQKQQLKEVGLSDVRQSMDNFNNLFFTWESWGQFDKNMKKLRQLYPKIDEGDKVDISGEAVGTGKSPVSTYENEFYSTTNKHEIAEMVTQSKEGVSDKSSTVWYIVGDENDDNKFNISHMKRYRELSIN